MGGKKKKSDSGRGEEARQRDGRGRGGVKIGKRTKEERQEQQVRMKKSLEERWDRRQMRGEGVGETGVKSRGEKEEVKGGQDKHKLSAH